MLEQRNIVEVEFALPQGTTEKHPVIILSNYDINNSEQGFVAVMMTSEPRYKDDEYSFELKDSMLTKPIKTNFSAVRIHLIGYFKADEILKNSNYNTQIKIEPFKRLLTQINSITFNLENFLIE